MNVREYGVLFWTGVGVLALLVASPVLSRALVFPRTEFFTELWILDENHRAENYPFNITCNQNYSVLLGVGNHLGRCAYYSIMVKFRNESQPSPTSFGAEGTRMPSNVSSLFALYVFVGDMQVWEQLVTFSFSYTYDNVTDRVDFTSMTFNDATLNMSGYTAARNANTTEYPGYLFFETWLYRSEMLGFTYHERFVSLRLNMTT